MMGDRIIKDEDGKVKEGRDGKENSTCRRKREVSGKGKEGKQDLEEKEGK